MTTTHEAEQSQELPQGDLRLLETDLAQRLLQSAIPARMAFVWTDGTPRVVPTWFHWTGREIVMVTYVAGTNIGIRHPAARLAALRANPDVALTIDTEPYPPQSLTVRGRARSVTSPEWPLNTLRPLVVTSVRPPPRRCWPEWTSPARSRPALRYVRPGSALSISPPDSRVSWAGCEEVTEKERFLR